MEVWLLSWLTIIDYQHCDEDDDDDKYDDYDIDIEEAEMEGKVWLLSWLIIIDYRHDHHHDNHSDYDRLWAGVHKPFPRRSKFQDQ